MHAWENWAMDRVLEITRRDDAFQELMAEHNALVSDFERLLDSLEPEKRDLILDYLNISGDLDYRRTQIAFEVGRNTRK